MDIVGRARALMSLISPLTGTISQGSVTFQASGADVSLPMGTYMYPVIQGKKQPTQLFKVDEGPNPDKSWTITAAGTAVAVVSMLGGIRYNVPASTPFLLDPPVLGLVAAQPTADANFTGGVDATGFGAVKDVITYESMDGPDLSLDMRRSMVMKFPAVVVTFSDILPGDGSPTPTTNRPSRTGTRKFLYKMGYVMSVIAARDDSDHERRHEGLQVVTNILKLVSDRSMIDSECVSQPGGVQVLQVLRESGPQDIYQKFYVYDVAVALTATLQTTYTKTFPDWLRAVLNVDKPQNPPLPNQGTFRLVDGMEIDMS